jgi:hypothetical protein
MQLTTSYHAGSVLRAGVPMRPLDLRLIQSFQLHYMPLGSTQPLTENEYQETSWGVKAGNLIAICGPNVYKMWEPRRLTILWAFTACYMDLLWIKWHCGRFSPSTSVSPANSHSTSYSPLWYNKTNSGRRTKCIQSHHTRHKRSSYCPRPKHSKHYHCLLFVYALILNLTSCPC